MRADALFELWGDMVLRKFILEAAWAFSKDAALRARLIGHAWYWISLHRPQATTECYKEAAYTAMLSLWARTMPMASRWGKSAAYSRVWRMRRAHRRFYVKKMATAPIP
jgi:hypothetical protein